MQASPRHALAVVVIALVAGLLGGCGSAGAPGTTAPTGIDGLEVPTPSPDPADFVARVDNRYLPLLPGARWTYESTSSEGTREITVSVTDQTRVVAGVETTVVHAEVRDQEGGLLQETDDWFAQDRAGNVWWFGEDTTPSTAGSWEAGVDGAQAGLAMAAEPRIGDGYRMQLLEGVAEDQAEVLRTRTTLELEAESYDDVLVISETTALEPDREERRYYAPGIGLVAAETVRGAREQVELVSYTPGD